MNTAIQLNLFAAWTGLLCGFLSGLYLGLNFHRENWLGGYASFKRRLYRLAHVSFFGLAFVNLMFYFTARQFGAQSALTAFASWAFVAGAISMPVCCVVMAHFPKTLMLFSVPVLSLLAGGSLILLELAKL
jgi:hypothetical protein